MNRQSEIIASFAATRSRNGPVKRRKLISLSIAVLSFQASRNISFASQQDGTVDRWRPDIGFSVFLPPTQSRTQISSCQYSELTPLMSRVGRLKPKCRGAPVE